MSDSGRSVTSLDPEKIQTMQPTPELTTYGNIKLGWIQGVLIPCVLNIWGVMLFLRIAWVVAQAGIIFTCLIVLVSAVVCVITALSANWKENILIVLIVAGIASYYLGVGVGPRSDSSRAQGFVGVSWEQAKTNLYPDYRYSENQYHNFFSVFAIYFPAVTGVQAGANICGDLKDPATAIPKGTLLALAISNASYLAMTLLAGSGAMRDASGNVTDLHVTVNGTGALEKCVPHCQYGLHNNYQIMQLMALWSPLIYLGCWAATLSTALTNLLSVPRLIQALGRDRIYPGLIFFSKPYGRHGEPYRGYVLTFIVSLLFLLIAPLITNFYLASYALINFCTFHAAFVKSITWRPGFRYYNTWISLAGCVMCIIIMIIISWVTALMTTFIFLALYLVVHYRKPVANWGSSTDAQKYQETVSSILSISRRPHSTKYYNPQVLVLSGSPRAREWLVDIAEPLTTHGSFMILADIRSEHMSASERDTAQGLGDEWVLSRHLRAFYMLVQGVDRHSALVGLFQCCGLGKFTPNMVVIGFKENWQKEPQEELLNYYQMLQLAFEFKLALAVMRVPVHMRKPDYLKPRQIGISPQSSPSSHETEQSYTRPVMYQNSDLSVKVPAQGIGSSSTTRTRGSTVTIATTQHSSKSSVNTTTRLTTRKLYKPLKFGQTATLDAWCLYDDGGINILLPYIIARRNKKEKMALRIYMLAKDTNDYDKTHYLMSEMLKKFRIEYTELILVTGLMDPPTDETTIIFDTIIKNHRTEADNECLISDNEFQKLSAKTNRHLRLRELVIENSFDADLIVLTLPYPRQGSVSAAMYMAWLEILSLSMPPMLFIRGSTPVLDS